MPTCASCALDVPAVGLATDRAAGARRGSTRAGRPAVAASEPPHELIVAAIVDGDELGAARAARGGGELIAAGVAARAAVFCRGRRARRRLARGQETVDAARRRGWAPAGARPPSAEQARCDARCRRRGRAAARGSGAGAVRAVLARLGGARSRGVVRAGDGAPLRDRRRRDGRGGGRDAEPAADASSSIAQRRRDRGRAAPRRGREGLLALADGAGLLGRRRLGAMAPGRAGRVCGALVEAPPHQTVLVRRGRGRRAGASGDVTWFGCTDDATGARRRT